MPHDPGNVTLEQVRRAHTSTQMVSFQSIFGTAYNLRLQRLKDTLRGHKGNANHAFKSIRDGEWKVEIWGKNVEDQNNTVGFADPRHVYHILKNTLETKLRGLNFQLLQNIFSQERNIPEQVRPRLFGVWAASPKSEDAGGVQETTGQIAASEEKEAEEAGRTGGGIEEGRRDGEGEGEGSGG